MVRATPHAIEKMMKMARQKLMTLRLPNVSLNFASTVRKPKFDVSIMHGSLLIGLDRTGIC
jgi:hypothetical protein